MRRIRLATFDYKSPGAYFITVCTHDRRPILQGSLAALAERELCAVEQRFLTVTVDYHVIMTDHVHAIFLFDGVAVSLPDVMRACKSRTTILARREGLVASRLWQRSYYDRVIRSDAELERIRKYIQENPMAEAAALVEKMTAAGRASPAPTAAGRASPAPTNDDPDSAAGRASPAPTNNDPDSAAGRASPAPTEDSGSVGPGLARASSRR